MRFLNDFIITAKVTHTDVKFNAKEKNNNAIMSYSASLAKNKLSTSEVFVVV